MALKTFNIDSEIYKKFSDYCKKNGISMSKKIERFVAGELKNVGIETNKSEEKVGKEGKKEEHSFMKYC